MLHGVYATCFVYSGGVPANFGLFGSSIIDDNHNSCHETHPLLGDTVQLKEILFCREHNRFSDSSQD